jgi:hypothetical protein
MMTEWVSKGGGGGSDWMGRIKLKLERSCMGNVWEIGKNGDKNVWSRISKKCVDMEGQSVQVPVSERS